MGSGRDPHASMVGQPCPSSSSSSFFFIIMPFFSISSLSYASLRPHTHPHHRPSPFPFFLTIPQSVALGTYLATTGCHLLTGGGRGVMEMVSRSFVEVEERRGMVIGVTPALPHSSHGRFVLERRILKNNDDHDDDDECLLCSISPTQMITSSLHQAIPIRT